MKDDSVALYELERDLHRDQDCRKQIFELAHTDPIVAAYVNSWKNGTCSWEQMLTATVVALSRFNDIYRGTLVKAAGGETVTKNSPLSELTAESLGGYLEQFGSGK